MSILLPTPLPTLVSELLFSKVAHDLASPIGATENGLELLAEEDGGMAEDAMALVRQSAHSVASRLRFYRLCYGTVGGCKGMASDMIRHVLLEFYRYEQKHRLHFSSTLGDIDEHGIKLLLCLMHAATDALPYGGTTSAEWGGANALIRLKIESARPEKPVKRGTVLPFMEGAPLPDDLSPYNIHAWYTGFYAYLMGREIDVQPESDSILVFTVR
jgi:histidine phosphotransferase ChpT